MSKAERRRLMPWSSSIVDDIRNSFGELAYIHAEENGHRVTWGQRTEGVAVVPVQPPDNAQVK